MERIVVIGMGIISAIGMNRNETIESIKSLKDGLVKKDKFFGVDINDIGAKFAGEVDINSFCENSKYDKNYILSKISFKEAIDSSNFDIKDFHSEKVGIFFGSCNGNLLTFENIYRNFDKPRNYTYNSMTFFNGIDVVMDYYRDNYKMNFSWPKYMFSNACSSSNMAINFAYNKIKSLDIDIAFVGGSDTLSEITFLGFDSFRSISDEKCSSFSVNSGLNLGDGAAWMILTKESIAIEKNYKIFAEINGSATYLNGNRNIVSPDISGETLSICMKQAIKKSFLEEKDIKIICSHGTGTELNNLAESNAIKKTFLDEKLKDIFVTSIKPYFGHTLGASGVMQNVIMIDCMNLGFVPPILHFVKNSSNLDDNNLIKNDLFYYDYDHFLSNSSAFGGNDVSIVISKYKGKTFDNIYTKFNQNKIFITNISMHTPLFSNYKDFFNAIKNRNILKNNEKYIVYDNFLKNIFLKDNTLRKHAKNPDYIRFSIKVIQDLIKNLDISNNREIGLFFSNYQNICSFIEDFYVDVLNVGKQYASAMKFQNSTFNSTVGYISNIFGIKGIGNTFFGSSISSLDYGVSAIKSNLQKKSIIFASDSKSNYYNKQISEKYYNGEILSEGASGIILSGEDKNSNEDILCEILGYHSNSFCFQDTLIDKTLDECINATLDKENIKLKEIDLHISKKFFTRKESDFNSTKYTGFLETSSPLIDIIMAIYFIKNEGLKTILLSTQSLQGMNCSFLLKKV